MIGGHGFLDHTMLDNLERLGRSKHHEVDLTHGLVRREGLCRAVLVDHKPLVGLKTAKDSVTTAGIEVPCEYDRVFAPIEKSGQGVRLGQPFLGRAI